MGWLETTTRPSGSEEVGEGELTEGFAGRFWSLSCLFLRVKWDTAAES